jgi:hypothetical protein
VTDPTPSLWKNGGLLDPAPFREVIARDAKAFANHADDAYNVKSGLSLLAADTGLLERQLYRITKGETRTVALDLVDHYCCKTGRHLADLYPHLYEPEQVDADVAERERLDAPKKARRLAQLRASRQRARQRKTPEQLTADRERRKALVIRNRAEFEAVA